MASRRLSSEYCRDELGVITRKLSTDRIRRLSAPAKPGDASVEEHRNAAASPPRTQWPVEDRGKTVSLPSPQRLAELLAEREEDCHLAAEIGQNLLNENTRLEDMLARAQEEASQWQQGRNAVDEAEAMARQLTRRTERLQKQLEVAERDAHAAMDRNEEQDRIIASLTGEQKNYMEKVGGQGE